MEIKNDELIKILSHFPKIDYAIAYGSSVIPQIGYNIEKNKNSVIDFIFGIKDSKAWHYKNLEKNFHHYSFLRLGGSDIISKIQQNYGAKVYYNTFVTIENKNIKYGVINFSDLYSDLLNWDTLYVSGRMQKPYIIRLKLLFLI
jgi:translocator assembly and maintenance protein 41